MKSRPSVLPQIRRLAETATALRAGTSTYFPITRLTSIKSLCKEPAMAARFVFYLAERTLEKVQAQECPEYTDAADWMRYQSLISEAVLLMRDYLQTPTERNLAKVWVGVVGSVSVDITCPLSHVYDVYCLRYP